MRVHLRVGVDSGILFDAIADAAAAAARAGIVIGIEHGERKVTIVFTAPAPVDMEQSVAVVAVAHEGMATGAALAAIDNRPPGGQFAVDDFLPFVDIREDRAKDDLCGVIVEVVDEGPANVYVVCSRAAYLSWSILHLYGLSAVAHQRCHSLILGFGGLQPYKFPGFRVVVAIVIGHVVPVEPCRGQGSDVPRLRDSVVAIFNVILRHAIWHRIRPLPVVHHLRHGRGHAAH